MRPTALLVIALAFGAPGISGAADPASPMVVELLAADAPSSEPPKGAATVTTARGSTVEVMLPYSGRGSWLRITMGALPPEPRLVVNGVAMERTTLVLPDGRRIERAKANPATDPAASAVAAVFPLPPEVSAGSVLWLHTPDRHRYLLDVRLLSATEWRQRERVAIAFALAAYGALGAFVIIAATYWAILRERMFADHALYVGSLLLFMSASSGLFYVAFNDGLASRLGIQLQWGFATAAIAFAVGFATRFIDVGGSFPRLARGLDALRIVLIVLAVAVTFSPVPTPYFGAAMALTLVAINLLLVGLGFHAAHRRSRYAGYFLLGWIPLTLGTSTRAFQATGLVQIPYEMSFVYALGVLWEALVLTAGIADRALSFRRERDVARHLADHDGLTGVRNRRASEARLEEAFRQARSASSPLAVFVLDLDHFKSINDRYGHAVGDAVLVAVARRIAAQLRPADMLGRWGGEEFIVILPGAPLDAARATGERIRQAVEAQPIHAEDQLVPVTVSVGVAMLSVADEGGLKLVQRADAALYQAKDSGRNRVAEASEVALPA